MLGLMLVVTGGSCACSERTYTYDEIVRIIGVAPCAATDITEKVLSFIEKITWLYDSKDQLKISGELERAKRAVNFDNAFSLINGLKAYMNNPKTLLEDRRKLFCALCTYYDSDAILKLLGDYKASISFELFKRHDAAPFFEGP